ncbi:hypothetical protein N0V93_002343 [Gnomoniopsis smithogilvyi]|uniref:Yeast cell wall synthesis Kre9/Knh1-like N-terminal domain-containing protein n=1 Tax=Gnomoniopsis smithogilvyi TaxID=1191159 RepID=A0A9W8YWJ2_9PEZI|nr:hypothetical protein N0V93_002343 [Gnomoniopsis smithogilvyi]
MFAFQTLSLAALAGLLPSLVQGIDFTSPTTSDVITKGSDITATWTSVDTDPSIFSLYVWNFVAWPPYYEALAYGVDTTAGEVTVRIPCHISNGEGWQLTAINDTNVYVLYAQTDKFNVTGDSCTDPTTSASCYAPTSTVYVTQTAGGATTSTAVSTGTVTASVIQPGIVDGTTTSQPTVAPTTASAALLSLDVDIAI